MPFQFFKQRRRKLKTPIDKAFMLEDKPGLVYVWVVKETQNGLSPIEISQFINSAFVQEYGHEPRALHIVLREIEDIQRMTADEYKQRYKPYLGGK